MTTTPSIVTWDDNGAMQHRVWRSERTTVAPKKVLLVDDQITADDAYRHACAGTGLLWRGDFQNARQLLQALTRRLDRKPNRRTAQRIAQRETPEVGDPAAFHQYRQARAHRARILNMLLVEFQPGHRLDYRRAPDVAEACRQAFGSSDKGYVMSLRELLGVVGAYEWRRTGVVIPELGKDARIHPHYGVFSPVRNEYLQLIKRALDHSSWPALAFDIGVGTGVLTALLLQGGIRHVIATDIDEEALICARANLDHLFYDGRYTLLRTDLFPEGRAPLIVCNPPWLPARPTSRLEHAVYDPDSQMLKGFLNGLAAHLEEKGEGWLIMSNLAELLGLRPAGLLEQWIAEAGLQVVDRIDTRPTHGKAADKDNPLYAARAAEITSLWRLRGAI